MQYRVRSYGYEAPDREFVDARTEPYNLLDEGARLVKKLLWIIIGLLVAGGLYLLWEARDNPPAQETDVRTQTPAQPDTDSEFSFSNPKKGAHFESSTPAHSSVLAAVPVEVVIDFNFDLASISTITIEKDGRDYGIGKTSVDDNQLAMRRKLALDAPDGVYTVNYQGCWPDQTCHNGQFQFAIDRDRLESFEDRRGEDEVTVNLSQLRFRPMNLRISLGTKVTWVNDDGVEHYVNTDSHPAHTQVLDFNSRALAKGETFSYTFTRGGAYPYHCSAHAADMRGNIVVET